MSLILDALRKSEAERRRGQSPSLYSAMPVPSTRRPPAWLRLLPMLLGALLLLAAGWFALRRAGEPATGAQLQSQASDVSAPDAAGDAFGPGPAPVAANPAPGPAQPGPPPAAPAQAQARAPAPAAAKSAPELDAPVPVPPPITTPARAPTLPAASPSPPLAGEPAAATPAPPDALPPVAVLDAGTRSALPPMKLSMHVFNSDPARRFAIIDGQRVVEGARLGAASVMEIRRDGVVLDVNGRRVLLPRP